MSTRRVPVANDGRGCPGRALRTAQVARRSAGMQVDVLGECRNGVGSVAGALPMRTACDVSAE